MSAASTLDRDANSIIQRQLAERAEALEQQIDADLLAYLGPMYPPIDDAIKDAVEGISPRRRSLAVMLETGGGYIAVAERVARIFRRHYRRVDFVVPTYAMSAGTVLAMSGDSIHMDYASALGPIDPQVQNRAGQWVPALGYLEQYDRLIQKSRDGTLTTAELAFLLQNFDAAELYQYEQEVELSIELLKEWLVRYKFKNWKVTETTGTPVTRRIRVERAQEIAAKLNDTKLWHSHSRGITIEMLRKQVNILIDDFGSNALLAERINDYFRLLQDYRAQLGHFAFVLHTRGRYVGLPL
ncbi:MAG: SDH family Clp fold serine proteinase [Gaiellaceae bacterium]